MYVTDFGHVRQTSSKDYSQKYRNIFFPEMLPVAYEAIWATDVSPVESRVYKFIV